MVGKRWGKRFQEPFSTPRVLPPSTCLYLPLPESYRLPLAMRRYLHVGLHPKTETLKIGDTFH